MKLPVNMTNFMLNPLTNAFAASVDYETDKKIQQTISHEFADRTILCIARMYPVTFCLPIVLTLLCLLDRLRTIIGYDRICVMDAGKIAEFDTPTRLYASVDGIFRGMCDRSSISLEDIRRAAKIQAEAEAEAFESEKDDE